MQPPAAEEYGAFAAEIGGNAAGQGLAAALFVAVPLDLLAAPAHRSPLSPPGTVRGRCAVSDSGPFLDLRADVRRGKRRRCLWRAWVATRLSLTRPTFASCLAGPVDRRA